MSALRELRQAARHDTAQGQGLNVVIDGSLRICKRGQGSEETCELRRADKGRRTRATSETDASDGADVEGHFQRAGSRAEMRRCGQAGSACFVDEAHDIVAVSAIEDSSDP